MQALNITTLHPQVFAASRLSVALMLALGTMSAASAATLSVGPGKTYATPCAAIAVANDRDTIEIAGNTTYSGDVCYIKRNNLTIRGVNGRPKIDAAGKSIGDKGIWVITGVNTTVENVEMYGAKVGDRNGAAIRLEGTRFTMRQSFLHDNENGILAGPNLDSDILIEYSEFGHNGYGDGYSHNLYIGQVKSLTFRYNYSHDANIGHNLKSRANLNGIFYNRFSSTPAGQTGSTASGRPSYEIDLPNGGTSYIIGNIIQQPSDNANSNIVAYGEEGVTNTGKDLYVVNNTFLNDYSSGGAFLLIGSTVTTPVLAQNNIFAGIGPLSTQASTIDRTNYRAAAPGFVNRAAYDLHPTPSGMVIDAGSDPGTSAAGISLRATGQYKATAYGETRAAVGKIDIGAYEAGLPASSTPSATPVISVLGPLPTDGWMTCADEGGTCTFSGTRQVRYGGNGVYATKIITGSTPCTNAVFGDPIKGTAKTCSYSDNTIAVTTSPTPAPAPTPTVTAMPTLTVTPTLKLTPTLTVTPATTTTTTSSSAAGWTVCATEGSTCNFSGTREVRYGTATVYFTKLVSGPVPCTNAVFGDPIKSTTKSCSYASTTTVTSTSSANMAVWTPCAIEGSTCSFSGKREVRYGTPTIYNTKIVTGPVACTNAVFGDPIKSTTKSCTYSSVTQ